METQRGTMSESNEEEPPFVKKRFRAPIASKHGLDFNRRAKSRGDAGSAGVAGGRARRMTITIGFLVVAGASIVGIFNSWTDYAATQYVIEQSSAAAPVSHAAHAAESTAAPAIASAPAP